VFFEQNAEKYIWTREELTVWGRNFIYWVLYSVLFIGYR